MHLTTGLALLVCALASQGGAQEMVYRSLPGPSTPLIPSPAEWSRLLEQTKLVADPISNEGKTPQPPSAGKPISTGSVIGKQITGGATATRGQWPWQAACHFDNAYFCGGSLISGVWVLTASHCVDGRTVAVVSMGAQDRSIFEDTRVALHTTNLIKHEQYNPTTIQNDIALIKLPYALPVPGPNWNVIRLPRRSQLTTTFEGVQGIISGWGRVSDAVTTPSETLNWVTVTVISTANCSTYYSSGLVTSGNICLWTNYNNSPMSSCKGDSGGPLAYKEADGLYTLLGVTSFGSASGCQKLYPVGYVRVTAFMQWISDKTGIAIQD